VFHIGDQVWDKLGRAFVRRQATQGLSARRSRT
jgi:hypothetical protein